MDDRTRRGQAALDERANRPPLLVPAAELVRAPQPIHWLVRDFFEAETLGLLFGEPGAGKSFLALDLAACIATGRAWHGHAVTPAPVAYVAGEGFGGLSRRLRAWTLKNSTSLENAPLFISRRVVPFLEPSAVGQLMDELDAMPQPPGLLVVDTLARAFAGADENSTKDMGAFVAACDALKARYRCAVLVVHHSGHADKSRARGSSALKASLDHEYGASRDTSGVICLQCWKSKDSEPPQPLGFALEGVALDWAGDEGNPLFSAVPVPAELSATQPDICSPNGTWPPKALEILRQLFQRHRANLEEAGLEPGGARVSAQDWRKACESQGIPRQRFHDAVTSLNKNGFIDREEDYVYPTA